MSPSWRPEISTTNAALKKWYRSTEFERDCKPEEFPGALFLDPDASVVYFDIEVER